MSYPTISVTMPQADIDAVKAAIATIHSKMPFLVSLAPEERNGLTKLGSGSVDFAQDAYLATVSYPSIFPSSFDSVEFGKDYNLFKALTEIEFLLGTLHEKVESTQMAVGSETMEACLQAYTYVQASKKAAPGLPDVAKRMKERFKKQSRKSKKGPDASASEPGK
ncbi:MAG: hypothetical protein HOP30_19000 [Cyclobacteriaceae bacterium]|nr:hypothetical protein [Cyclobacteriaceae bacterium]